MVVRVSVIGQLWLSAPRRELLEAEAAGGGLLECRGNKMAAETVELHKLKVPCRGGKG